MLFNSTLEAAAIRNPLSIKQPTLFTSATWEKDFWTLQGSDLVEASSQTPWRAINESVLVLGKGKARVQEIIETPCTRSLPPTSLTPWKDYFSLLCCFMSLASFVFLTLQLIYSLSNRGCNRLTPDNSQWFFSGLGIRYWIFRLEDKVFTEVPSYSSPGGARASLQLQLGSACGPLKTSCFP